jgi:hypothetical protein
MVDNPKIMTSWQPGSLGFTLATEISEPSGSALAILNRIRSTIIDAGAHKVVDTGPTSFRFKRKWPGWTMSALNVVDRGNVQADYLGSYTRIAIKTTFLRWLIGGVIFAAFVTMQGRSLGYGAAMFAFVMLGNGCYTYFVLRSLLARATRETVARAA